MQADFPSEGLVHTVEFLIMGFIAWIVLKIDNTNKNSTIERMKMKEELMEGQHEMREDMDAKHAENKQQLAVHVEADRVQFEALGRTLQRIDRALEAREHRRNPQ